MASGASIGSIEWKEDEYKYMGIYTGGLRNGLPHGAGNFVQNSSQPAYCHKQLMGEWVDGVKQGPFVRLYGNGFRWVGNYVDGRREGDWKYMYAGTNPVTNVYHYSKGVRLTSPAVHRDGLHLRTQTNPIF